MKQVSRTFQAPDFSQHQLRYFVSSKGQHCVVHRMPAGVDLHPNVYRYNTIDEARNMWRNIQNDLIEKGYIYEK